MKKIKSRQIVNKRIFHKVKKISNKIENKVNLGEKNKSKKRHNKIQSNLKLFL